MYGTCHFAILLCHRFSRDLKQSKLFHAMLIRPNPRTIEVSLNFHETKYRTNQLSIYSPVSQASKMKRRGEKRGTSPVVRATKRSAVNNSGTRDNATYRSRGDHESSSKRSTLKRNPREATTNSRGEINGRREEREKEIGGAKWKMGNF